LPPIHPTKSSLRCVGGIFVTRHYAAKEKMESSQLYFSSGLRNVFLHQNPQKHPAGRRSLHWKMRIKGAWGTPPTSILQRKISRCIYVCIACGRYEASQPALQF